MRHGPCLAVGEAEQESSRDLVGKRLSKAKSSCGRDRVVRTPGVADTSSNRELYW